MSIRCAFPPRRPPPDRCHSSRPCTNLFARPTAASATDWPERISLWLDENNCIVHTSEKWDDYVHAVDDMVLRTSSPDAPWHVIPANDKYTARLRVLEHVNEGLRQALKRKG